MINQQAGGAPSQHDPNEALDQISEDNLTQDAHKMRTKLLTQLAGQEINAKENTGFELLNVLAFPRATSTTNSTTSLMEVDLCTSLPSGVPEPGRLPCSVTRLQLLGMRDSAVRGKDS